MISASGAEPLPTNGDKWHEIRQGKLPFIPQVLSQDFLGLLKVSADQPPAAQLRVLLFSNLDLYVFNAS